MIGKLQKIFDAAKPLGPWNDKRIAERFGLKVHQVRGYRLRHGVYYDDRERAPYKEASLRKEMLLSLMTVGSPTSTIEATQALNDAYGPVCHNAVYRYLKGFVKAGLVDSVGGGQQLRFIKRRS